MNSESLVEKCEQVCDAIESLKFVIRSDTISLNASIAKARVFYFIEVRHGKFDTTQQCAYDSLCFLVNDECSGWKRLCAIEKIALLRSLGISHDIFVYI